MAGSDFIVAEGLKGGEQLIVNGLQKVRPGASVKTMPWQPNPVAPAGAPQPAVENKKKEG
jgi:membrane fusion protein (multidrug efflux system)